MKLRKNNKIKNDKYFTSLELAKYIVDKTKEIIGDDNITQYIEPSAGAGVFLDLLDKDYLAYDIEPEDNRIVQQNYLELELDYMEGRCIIGNPPFGEKGNLVRQFYNKSIMLGDYIAFILPISQWNNNVSLYKFDLIYSENLGKRMYSDREVHCAFNIYRRPNILNSRPTYELEGIKIEEACRNINRMKKIEGEDYRIKAWGGNKETIGEECNHPNEFAKELCFFIRPDIKDKVIQVLKDVKWCELYPMTGTPNLSNWQVLKYLGEQFQELKKKVNIIDGLNKKPTYELEGIKIEEWRRGEIKEQIVGEDYRINKWGGEQNRIGYETDYPNQYVNEICFFIREDYKDKVIQVLKDMEYKWCEIYPKHTKALNINIWEILKYLGECFPELKKKVNPLEGLNKRPTYELDGIEAKLWMRNMGITQIDNEDYRINIWGGSHTTIGHEAKYPNATIKELCFFIRPDYKDKVIQLLKEVKWNKIYGMTSMATLQKWQVMKYLSEQFPELKKQYKI